MNNAPTNVSEYEGGRPMKKWIALLFVLGMAVNATWSQPSYDVSIDYASMTTEVVDGQVVANLGCVPIPVDFGVTPRAAD